jgi:hypothetical protein
MFTKRFFYVCAGLLCVVLAPGSAAAQVFHDDFNGTALAVSRVVFKKEVA